MNPHTGRSAIALVLTTATTVVLMTGCGAGDPYGTNSEALSISMGLPASPSTAPSSTQSLLRLYEAASIFAAVASSGLEATTVDDVLWTVGPCVYGSGSLQMPWTEPH